MIEARSMEGHGMDRAPNGPILFTTNTLGFFDGEVNGVAYTGCHLLHHFEDAGIEVDVLTYGNENGVHRRGSVTIHVHDASRGIPIDPALRIDPFVARGTMAARLARRNYALVHTTSPDPLGWLSIGIARRCGAPLVAGYHTAVDEYLRRRIGAACGQPAGDAAAQAMASYLAWFYDRADLVLATTPSMKRILESRLFPPVEILGRGVDPSAFSPRFRTRSRAARPRALYVGRLAEEKGLDQLVPLFRDRDEVELVMVGDGPARMDLERALPRATFTGVLTGTDLASAFADGDLFVFPSVTETFGNVVLQALASGVPCVVMDTPGPGEIVRHGVSGIVARDAPEFTAAVDFLLGHEEVRARMAEAAVAQAREFTWSAVFERLLTLYEICGPARRSSRAA